jgi:hypothetical protein
MKESMTRLGIWSCLQGGFFFAVALREEALCAAALFSHSFQHQFNMLTVRCTGYFEKSCDFSASPE